MRVGVFVLTFLCMLGFNQAFAQAITVAGTVTDAETGDPLIGATILIQNSSVGTVTDFDGKYTISADDGDVLVISYTGYTTQEVTVGAESVIDVALSQGVLIDNVVVTGYTSERKADIIGSVSVIDTDDMLTTPAANLTSQLSGRAAGVTASGGGEPGAAATVRIRGFTSFGNSDPLYVIDGVPTSDPSKVNPQDIASIQVLKDATSASIYGARASQGVIIITTKQGKKGASLSLKYDGFVGTAFIPQSKQPDLLNTAEYLEYLQKNNGPDYVHPVFGAVGEGNIPDRFISSGSFKGGVSASDPRANLDLYSLQDYGNVYQIYETGDTDWFDEITQNGLISSHQLTASGGTEKSTYSFGFNRFDQEGTLIYTGYNRTGVRLNSSYEPTSFLKIGENVQVLYEKFQNGSNVGEGAAWAQAFRMVPYIPVYDLGGGWGGNAVGESGNGTNPVAQLWRDQNDKRENWKIFGNVYAELEPIKDLTFRTSFGIDYGNFFSRNLTLRTYERSENVGTPALGQSFTFGNSWTWTNTAVYSKSLGVHDIKLLAGTEAVSFYNQGISVSSNTFDFEDDNFVTLATEQTITDVSSPLDQRRLSSYFGRVDYTFNNKYLVNATVRRDGSSVFGSDNRYGVFPAFGLGWRVSEEAFMQNVGFIDDFKIRGGWGQMGSERVVPAANQYSFYYFAPGVTNYDIGRTQTGLDQGYTARRVGSDATKWETTETTNVGFDASLFNYKWDISFTYFNNDTKDLLVAKVPTAIEPIVAQPFINIGKMRNRGFDFNITNRGNITSDLRYDATLTFTHYRNTVIDIDGNEETFFSANASRINNVSRTQAGYPIASFYGFELDGFFDDEAELNSLQQESARVGGWKFKDQNGDGVIDDEDRTFIGSPHPDFVAGLNLGLQYKNFDAMIFLLWNQGNDLFNFTKWFTEMRGFVGGVSKRVLTDTWSPENPDAALPRLAPGEESGFNNFTSGQPSSYYVEDASFLSGRTLQLGYTLPSNTLSKIGISSARLYLQGQNIFTLTNYLGADPDIGNLNARGNDLSMGIDETRYPTATQYIFGFNFTF